VDESHIAVRASHELNWTTRAEVIKNFVSSVDYQMFVAPTGDLLLEFPFADFRPEDFGEFRDAFRVNKVLQNSKFGDMQQDPVSAVVVTTGFVKGGSQTNKDAVDLTKVVAVSPILAARYGVTVAPVQIPFLKFTDTAIAQQRAVIELQKRNSMCNALSFSPSYRPFLLPNRPIHHIKRTRMGTAGTVNYTYDVGSATPSAKCDVGLEYVRVWTGYYRSIEGEALQDIQKRQITASGMTPDQLNILDQPKLAADDIELQVYTTVMAGESIPVSARLGWGPKAVCTPNSGILIIDPKKITVPPEDTGPTAHEAQAANNTQAFTPLELPNIPPQNHKFKSDPTTVLRITSKFGPRQDPKDGSRSFHDGVDFGVAAGTPLYAVDDGKVIIARFDQDSGNHIAILTDDGYRATYCHMTNMELQVGARVSAGQRIGTSGATGRVTGPHLHFIVIPPVGKRSTKDQALNGPDGGAVDPLDVLPLTGVIPAPAATGVS
jgi:hypothetical protein